MICLSVNNSDHVNRSKTSDKLTLVTVTRVRENGSISRATKLDGVLHAGPLGEPSIEIFSSEGFPINKEWHSYGVRHRLDGPSAITYHDGSHQVMTEVYEIDGMPRSANDGPHVVRWNKDGTLAEVEYAKISDIGHNLTSPALKPF